MTKLFFRDLPAAPTEAYLWSTAFDWSTLDQAGFRRLVQNYGNFMAEHSGVDSPYNGSLSVAGAIAEVGGAYRFDGAVCGG